jgi:WD40 repeat protein
VIAFAVAPDGSKVYGWVAGAEYGKCTFSVWNTDTGERRDLPAERIDIRLNGYLRLVDSGRMFVQYQAGRMLIRDVVTGKRVHSIPCMDGYSTFAPDGKTYYQTTTSGIVSRIDVTTGKRLGTADPPGGIWSPRFDSRGRILGVSVAVYEEPYGRFRGCGWDVRTGNPVFQGFEFKENKDLQCQIMDISPDGRRVVARVMARPDYSNTLRVYDALTGAAWAEFVGHKELVKQAKFSPDGGRILSESFIGANGRETLIWDARTGQLLVDQNEISTNFYQLVSPDGRTRAECDRDTRQIHLVECATGTIRHSFYGSAAVGDRPMRDAAVSPDGRYLAAVGMDARIYVWDIRGGLSKPATPPDAAALTADWNALASSDAAAAFRAIRRLAHFPDISVPFLREKLPPLFGPAPDAVAKLVEKLDAPTFADRETAEKRLKALGELAAPALRDAVRTTASAEVKQRAERLLAPLDANKPGPEQLRAIRAVEAGEWMGTPAAKELLTHWANGAAGARLTVEAKAAAGR